MDVVFVLRSLQDRANIQSMLAAGLGSGLVAGLGFARLTSTLVAALHVGSERLLADFDALFGF